jgi:hypothetical protein
MFGHNCGGGGGGSTSATIVVGVGGAPQPQLQWWGWRWHLSHNCGGGTSATIAVVGARVAPQVTTTIVAEVLSPPPPLQLQLKCHLSHKCGSGASATIAAEVQAPPTTAIVAEVPPPQLQWSGQRWHFSCSCSGGGGASTSATPPQLWPTIQTYSKTFLNI